MKLRSAAIIVLATASVASAQPAAKRSDAGAYLIPYAASSNRVELYVLNSTDRDLKDVVVEAESILDRVTFEETRIHIGELKAGESQPAGFSFDMDERAPVGEVTSIDFDVVSAAGLVETRTVRIHSEARTELTLRGNYPNPFNPSTRIAYALPTESDVRIEIFNTIGQRVARLFGDVQPAGYQEVLWDSSSFPSGVYFYSITIHANQSRSAKFGKMLLVK